MNHYARLFGIFVACYAVAINGSSTHTSPYIYYRSQGENLAREVAGYPNHVNLNVGRFYGTTSVAFEYSKSFHSQRILQCLFGDDLLGCNPKCRSIKISGSGVAKRNATKDWLADYFGLPRDYQSTISFCPRVENVIADFSTYFGLDSHKGLYLKFHIPVVYTKWNLNFSEDIENSGTANHQPGYFNGRVTLGTPTTKIIGAGTNIDPTITINSYPNAYGVARSNLVSDFASYACNKAVPILGSETETVGLPNITQVNDTTINTILTNADFPLVVFNPLCKAQFVCEPCDITKVGIADLQITAGLNAIQTERSHFGFGLRIIAPTGNRPEGKTVFEPMLGNGKHWGFGLLVSAHRIFWQTEDEKQKLGIYVDSNITHLFKAKQKRTFDLACKPNSRYMLAEKMTSKVENLAGSQIAGASPATTIIPNAQFALQFTPLANLSTLEVDVSIGIQTDTVFMISYQHGDFVWDIGYNLWTSSCEKIKLRCENQSPFADGKTWVLKGDAQVYGYAGATSSSPIPITTTLNPFGVPLSASQSQATIHGGTNGYKSLDTKVGTLSLRPTQNPGVDNNRFAVNSADLTQIINDNPNLAETDLSKQVKTSVNPLFITNNDLDISGARTKGLSNKLFTNIAYTWVGYKENWDPYIGGGFEGEFYMTNKNCSTSCNRCGISQWGAWIKGGASFN